KTASFAAGVPVAMLVGWRRPPGPRVSLSPGLRSGRSIDEAARGFHVGRIGPPVRPGDELRVREAPRARRPARGGAMPGARRFIVLRPRPGSPEEAPGLEAGSPRAPAPRPPAVRWARRCATIPRAGQLSPAQLRPGVLAAPPGHFFSSIPFL